MSYRIEQINELIHRELSNLFTREVEFPIGTLATITCVKTSRDLKYVAVRVSILPINRSGSVLKVLRKNIRQLQFLLNKRLKTRPLPRIKFELDETGKAVEEVDEALKICSQT